MFFSVGGNYLEGVCVDIDVEISKENIGSYITKIYGSDAKVNNEELVIYSLNDVEPTLYWKVTVEGAKNGELYTVNSFINAKTGELVNEVSLLTKGTEQGTGIDLKGESRTFNVNKKDILMSTHYELFDTERNIKIYKANLGYIPGIPITSINNTWNDPVAIHKLFYNSLFIMNSTANFQDCRIAVTSAANNLGMSSEELDIINNAFDEVGISVKTLE